MGEVELVDKGKKTKKKGFDEDDDKLDIGEGAPDAVTGKRVPKEALVTDLEWAGVVITGIFIGGVIVVSLFLTLTYTARKTVEDRSDSDLSGIESSDAFTPAGSDFDDLDFMDR